MTITCRLIDETEKERFNNFMITCPKGHILQTWEWGQVKAGWLPLRLIAERDGEIVGAVSLLKRTLPAKMGSLFYSPRGPVLNIEEDEVWQALLTAVKDLAQIHQVIFWKIDPDVKATDAAWSEKIQQAGFQSAAHGEGFEGIQPRYVFRLDISPEEEELLANCQQKTRYNIRLAQKKGAETKIATREELPVFYQLLTETAARDRFLIRPYSYYEKFYDYLVPQGLAEMFLTYYEGEAISGALTFKLGTKAWYIYGASSNAHRNVMPNYLMQWQMIQWSKAHNCTMYDFRGVPGDVPKDHPLYGLVRFKKGFGGEYVEFIGEFDLVYKKSMYQFYHWLEPKYQVAVRKWIRLKKKIKGQK